MNIEELRDYCLSVKGSTESLPFLGHDVLVFKVMDKMFAYVGLEPKDGIFRVRLKCDPNYSLDLREKYNGITETDFKTLLWNSVILDSDVPDELIKSLIDHSVVEVVKKWSRKKQEAYFRMRNLNQ